VLPTVRSIELNNETYGENSRLVVVGGEIEKGFVKIFKIFLIIFFKNLTLKTHFRFSTANITINPPSNPVNLHPQRP
jgi:hypothetical protein